jgi:hypothetical protein
LIIALSFSINWSILGTTEYIKHHCTTSGEEVRKEEGGEERENRRERREEREERKKREGGERGERGKRIERRGKEERRKKRGKRGKEEGGRERREERGEERRGGEGREKREEKRKGRREERGGGALVISQDSYCALVCNSYFLLLLHLWTYNLLEVCWGRKVHKVEKRYKRSDSLLHKSYDVMVLTR